MAEVTDSSGCAAGMTLALAIQIFALLNALGTAAENVDKVKGIILAHQAEHGNAADTTPLSPERVEAISSAMSASLPDANYVSGG